MMSKPIEEHKEPLLSASTEDAVSEKESCSVVVKNLQKSDQLQNTLNNFFSFCGTISSTTFMDDPTDPSLIWATLTFHEPSSAKTAVLLNNTQINDRFITVELLDSKSPRTNVGEGDQPSMIDELVQFAPVLEPVIEVGRSIDEKIHLSEAIGTVADTVRNLDKEYHVSETIQSKAAEIDNTLQISNNVAYVSGTIKNTLTNLEEEHHITQKVTDGVIVTGGVIVAGLEVGAQQVSQFMQTNETAKAGVDFVSDVGQQIGNTLNSWWNDLTSQPTPSSTMSSTTSTTHQVVTSSS